jgi:hypothetical protein
MSAKTFKAAAVATLVGLGLSTSVLADNAWNCEAVSFQGGAVNDVQCAGSFSPPPVILAIANSQFDGYSVYSGFFKDDNSAIGSTTFAIDVVGTGNGQGSIATVPPIPEPNTYVLMLAGVGAVGFMARRRRKI